MPRQYYQSYHHRRAPHFAPMSAARTLMWQFLAGIAIGTAVFYLHWRWTASLNPDAMAFSIIVATAETLFALGTALFFFDIWQEDDTPTTAPPQKRTDAGLTDDYPNQPISIDVFIATYDEAPEIVRDTIQAAQAVHAPEGSTVHIYVLDDGKRPAIAELSAETGVRYLCRDTNQGFKAGNLRNGLFQSNGDFVVICDADTLLFPDFLINTMGYFRDPDVAWVQTPHWFYDIPAGYPLSKLLRKLWPRCPRRLRRILHRLTGRHRIAHDPFLTDTAIFFDVIQRRRNRHAASFCCGAGSIHRREAVFEVALSQQSRRQSRLNRKLRLAGPRAASIPMLEPYRFHVSEDLYTSIDIHSATSHWRSVYHPQVEAKMLAPRSLEAFSTQRLKYAGGSIDIMLRDPPPLRKHMPWQHRLHYSATFYSYLSILWAPILLVAPAYSLLSGTAPVQAYSMSFFLHFLPMLIAHELAMLIGCKGHSLTSGRYLSVAALPLQLRAFGLVLRGKRPRFPPPPKPTGLGAICYLLAQR